MLPTLHPGDACLVWRPGRRRAGQLVVMQLPGRPLAVKRLTRRRDDGWEVAGDNPAESTDSRTLGALPEAALAGRVLWRYWPPVRRAPSRWAPSRWASSRSWE